ncbi:MAG TPA: hypothetical protein PLA71_00515 [Saccharofermentans sp.]|nr:hypothetical protein [Saccharofermentans sp.]
MKNLNAREIEFLNELKELLKKHDAVISADNHFINYGNERGEDIRMTVCAYSKYENNEMTAESMEIDLGDYVDGTSNLQ